MNAIFDLALGNLLSPIILSFALGLFAAMARSDLSIPEAVAKGMSIYLLFAIGFKGGAGVAAYGADTTLLLAIGAGVILSFGLPFIAFALLSTMTALDRTNRAAVAAHYGSISIVTFVAATSVLESRGLPGEGFMVAVAAAMEAPAILSALWLVARGNGSGGKGMEPGLLREIMLNGSIVLLVGAFLIGLITGEQGLAEIAPFIETPFKGVLCLFLLDMGLIAGRGLRRARGVLNTGAVAFAIVMPLVGAATALVMGLMIGLSPGGIVLLMTLGASASYIAVPAAMRVALPQADPSIYLTLSLGVTFPFNLTLGIPLYLAIVQFITGG
ncbi:MAG: sodium-dependent bicarbonate transport family permease [Loktanella sp.]|nr:sodium-dependent bicarbonate transport family permease [Loktanella sp.]